MGRTRSKEKARSSAKRPLPKPVGAPLERATPLDRSGAGRGAVGGARSSRAGTGGRGVDDSGFEPSDIVPRLLRLAMSLEGVEEAEAHASRNRMAIARIETLRHAGRQVGPNAQLTAEFANAEACVRVVVKGAVGTAATAYLDDASLLRTVREARRSARMMAPDPNFRRLAEPTRYRGRVLAPDREISEGDPVPRLLEQAEAAVGCVPRGMDLAGSIIAVHELFSVSNSSGLSVERGEDTFAVAQLTAERVEGADVLSSGMGWSSSRFLRGMDAAGAARRALELSVLEPRLRAVPEGDYDVILGPHAVADIMDNMLAPQMGMGQIYSGTSWLPADRRKNDRGAELRWPRLGTALASERITLREEPHIEDAMGSRSFDDEGVPTRPRALIDKGTWKGVLSNSYHAHLYGLEPPGNGFRLGPRPGRMASAAISNSPTNLRLEPGDLALEEMVELCGERALYIPRTWYTYPARYGASGFSSSNRSTAFLIEKKEMVPVAPNAFKLRGDVSRLLRGVRGIGKETSTATTWSASFCSIVPHVLTSGIRVEKPAE